MMTIRPLSGVRLTLVDIRQCIREDLNSGKYAEMDFKAAYDIIVGDVLHELLDYYNTPRGQRELATTPNKNQPVDKAVISLISSLYPIIEEEINAYFKRKS